MSREVVLIQADLRPQVAAVSTPTADGSESVVEVAAGYLACSQSGERLLTQRPLHKVRGGCWEFPGGKIEAGESPAEALVRELKEELGLTPSAFRKRFTCVHRYPDITIRLHVFDGVVLREALQPASCSVANLLWFDPNHSIVPAQHLSGADRRVLRRIQMPSCLSISVDCLPGQQEAWLSHIEASRPVWLLVRVPSLGRNLARQLALEARTRCPQTKVSVGADHEFAMSEGFGLQLKAAQLHDAELVQRLSDRWQQGFPTELGLLGASTHSQVEIKQAERLPLDYVTLSPVLPTASHPDALAIGWDQFAQWVQQTDTAVFALGGLGPDDLAKAQAHGAQGVAGISAFH